MLAMAEDDRLYLLEGSPGQVFAVVSGMPEMDGGSKQEAGNIYFHLATL